MIRKFILFTLTLALLIACRQTFLTSAKGDNEVLEYIKTQTEFIAIKNDSLPDHIKPYQTLVLEFLRNNNFNSDEYYVQTEIHTWTEDDEIHSDTSATHLSLNLYHLNYFKIMLQDKKDFSKDSVVTYRKGNISGKDFRITVDKEQKKILGPHYWK